MAATLKVDTIQNASSATANITLDTAGNATVGGGLTVTNTVAMGSSFLRNRIINGDMRIDQRNAGASVTPTSGTNTFIVDRFSIYASQSSKLTSQQNAGSVTPPAGYTKYLGVTSSSAYSITSSDWFSVRQPIEGFNIADLAWGTADAKTVTLSFWVRSSLTGTFGGSLRNGAGTYSYPFTYSISAANTWESKSITISGPTGGTWTSDNTNGVEVFWGLGVGSSNSGTAGSWASASYGSATGATSVVGTNGATFYITGVQLEVGSVATPFERRLYGQELALCQRYYTVTNSTNPKGASTGSIAAFSGQTNSIEFAWVFPVAMRATPSLTMWQNGTQNKARQTSNGTVVTITTLSLTSGANPNSSGFIYDSGGSPFTANVGYDFDLQASAEL